MKSNSLAQVNLERKYQDDDINDYINLIIENELGGFRGTFLLEGEDDGRFGDEDGNRYHVFVTPAIDSAGLSTSVAYFMNKAVQQLPVREDYDERRDIFDDFDLISPEELENIKIIFPFNITQHHWLSGEIKIKKLDNNIVVEIFAHDPYGKGIISPDNYIAISKMLEQKLENIFPNFTISIENPVSTYNRRQAIGDAVSCGVITTDDILKRIQGISLNVSQSYIIGAEELRRAHLNNVEKYEETSTKDNFISRNSIQQATTPHHPANNTIKHSINNTEGINKIGRAHV